MPFILSLGKNYYSELRVFYVPEKVVSFVTLGELVITYSMTVMLECGIQE